VNEQYPLILTTGRTLHHWHTRTKTGTVPQLNQTDPGPYLQMHPADAANLDLADAQDVEISSRRGRASCVLRLDPSISPGVVFMPIHWNELSTPGASPNELTTDNADAISLQPALKHSAVNVRAR
jgi:anaerobic selenocysteine-containing dehydrogenase